MYHLRCYQLSLIFLLCFLLPGCQASKTTALNTLQKESAPTLTIATRKGIQTQGLEIAKEQWEAETGINIELEAFDYSYLQEQIYLDIYNSRFKYDVILIDDPWLPSLAGSGLLTPLDIFGYEPDPDFAPNSISLCYWPPSETFVAPPVDERFSLHPQLYALPYLGNVQMFWYRQDLIPNPPAQLEQFVETLINTADPGRGLYAYAYPGGTGNPIVTEFNMWNWSYGGEMFDENWRVVLNNSKTLAALTSWQKLARYAVPNASTYTSSSFSSAAVLNNQAVASLIWPNHIFTLAPTGLPDHIRLTTFPPQEQQVSQLGHWVLAIPVTAQHKQEAFNFINWVTSPAVMKQYVGEGLPPTRTSLLNDPELIEQYAWLPQINQAMLHAKWRPRTPHWSKIETILGNYLVQVINQQTMTPAEALEQAAWDIEDLLIEEGYAQD